MAKKRPKALFRPEQIEQSIFVVRGHKVLLDSELAQFYGVETKALVRAMKRNIERFPGDFMFQLTRDEWTLLRSQFGTLDVTQPPEASSLRSQNVTLKTRRGRHRKYLPYAFTEQGVAMLSSVLRSRRAVQVNIEIMRAFVRLRRVLAVNAELARRLDEVEIHLSKHDEQFVDVIRAIRQLMDPPPAPPRRRIGFYIPEAAPSDDSPLTGRGNAKRRGRNTRRALRASKAGC
jgi:hypothetical protein